MPRILIVLCFLCSTAWAGDVTLTWTAPTLNEDGTPLTDLAGYNIYYGLTDGGPYPTTINVPNPAAVSFDVLGLSAGTYYFVATAFNTGGDESQYSGQAIKVITSIPAPPGSLTVSDLVAYAPIWHSGDVMLVRVGTVPSDTPCDPNYSVDGHYGVNRSLVVWDDVIDVLDVSSTFDNVVADCS